MLDNDAGQLLTTSSLSRCTSEPYHGIAAGGVRGDECALTGKPTDIIHSRDVREWLSTFTFPPPFPSIQFPFPPIPIPIQSTLQLQANKTTGSVIYHIH